MLKQIRNHILGVDLEPAAFRRLCVETQSSAANGVLLSPAAFRRLCVETRCGMMMMFASCSQPPSGGCVLKHV